MLEGIEKVFSGFFCSSVDVIEGLLDKSTNFENYVLFGVLSSRSQP